jgi:predicted RNA binding protein YcfA (HicA-like mRNA interferase family)
MTAKQAIRLLEAAGFVLRKISKSAHHGYRHPSFPDEPPVMVSLHGSRKELSPGIEATVRKALRNKK